ncbi:MAG: hypothetical protein AAFO81_07420 [Pseudomonadota bacterium]
MASRHSRTFALGVVAMTVLAGCSSLSKVMDRRQLATNQELSVDTSPVSVYLADIETLLGNDESARDRTWRELQLDYERAPTTTNQLRLALAKATPGHPQTDLADADAMLTSLLLEPERLQADEQLLANVHLGLLRSRINAESVARQAGSSETRNNERELAAVRSQLQLLQQDNQRLRNSLEDTEEKLRAITLIERSIRERNDESASNANPILEEAGDVQ